MNCECGMQAVVTTCALCGAPLCRDCRIAYGTGTWVCDKCDEASEEDDEDDEEDPDEDLDGEDEAGEKAKELLA